MALQSGKALRSKLRELKDKELDARKELKNLIIQSAECEGATSDHLENFSHQLVAACKEFE